MPWGHITSSYNGVLANGGMQQRSKMFKCLLEAIVAGLRPSKSSLIVVRAC